MRLCILVELFDLGEGINKDAELGSMLRQKIAQGGNIIEAIGSDWKAITYLKEGSIS